MTKAEMRNIFTNKVKLLFRKGCFVCTKQLRYSRCIFVLAV